MKLLLKKTMSRFPSRLPVGMTEFQQWSDEIIELCGPLADPDSMRWALSSQVMHLPPTTDKVPKAHFVASLRKAAANQVAHAVLRDLKNKQQAAAEAAKKAEQEQTAQESTAPGEQS